MAHSSDDTSYFARIRFGSFSIRQNIVGTNWVWLGRYFCDELQVKLRFEVLHDDGGAADPDGERRPRSAAHE